MIQKQRLNNRILSLVLALVMVLSMLPMASLTAFAADGDGCKTTDCTGTYTNGICSNGCYEPADLVGDVYQIGNAGQLYWFAQEVNGGNTSINAMLTENIVINEKVLDDDGSLVDDTAALRVWTSIGNAYFRGVFDGDGHTVSGLYTENSYGLFNMLREGATVKNVGIINSYTKNAGIVRNNYGTVSGCWVADSLISGDSYTGSIVRMNYGTVENCWSDAIVQTTGYYSGGLVGSNGGSISNCCNLGTTSGGTRVGAIAGDNSGSVINCYFISDNFSGAVGSGNGSVDTQTGGMTNVAARVIAGGEIYYFSDLQQAFDSTAVKSGTADEPATVTLLSNASSDTFKIRYAHIILDLNGFNVNCTSSYGTAIIVESGGITVRGEGTVTGYTALRSMYSITKVEGGTLEGSYYGIVAGGDTYYGGELHISGGTVNGGTTAIEYSGLNAFTISGGTFRDRFVDNRYGGSAVQPVITGGSFPEGIRLGRNCPALSALLGEDCHYYDADGKKVELAAGQKEIAGYVTVNVTVRRDISTATVAVTAPEAGEAKQTAVSGDTGYSAAIEWDCDTDTFGYNTAYTATVTLTADENHKFTSDLTVSGWDVVVTDSTTATLTKTFEPTRKAKLTNISAPTDTTLNIYYTDVADAIKELPAAITYTAESGSVTVDIEWTCVNYDSAVTKTNTFTWAVKGGELNNYDANGIATGGEITVTNADAITVENSGENKTITYSGSTYDVAGMFTTDKNAGEASYTITGGTGAGTLNGSVLTITKAGTIQIKLTTAANGAYAAGEATVTLTVSKGAGSGTVTIEGWTYGEYAKDPVISSSTNGTASVTYLYESTDGKGYTGSAAPKNAGSYKLTVTFAETDLYVACTADATFTIEKADPAIGAVTAGVVNDTLDISAIALNRANTSVDGVLTVDAGQELKLGDNEIAYTFTPADIDNYERVTGKVTVTVKDTIAPTGKVTLGKNSWNGFLDNITVALFFKETQTVSVEASDSFSGIEKIEYYAASDVLDLDGVKALADDKWTVMDGSVNVTAEDAKQFIYYIRITDKSGNIGYLATNGAEFDTTAPVIDGVHNGVTYYTTQKVTVTDKNLDTVTLDGEPVTGTVTLDGNKEATYIIVATDKAGNATTVTVTMKPIKELAKVTENLGNDNVTSDDAPALKELVEKLDELIADPDTSNDGERETLEQHKVIAESLLQTIEDAAQATDTENTEKVKDVTAENVTPENKTDLENAKADLEKTLEENGGNYTEDEKKAIEDEIKRIEDALKVIENVEAVEDQINNLPDTITKDDTDDVDAAKKAYDELSDYEKTLIDPAVKAKLDDAVKAAEDVNKPADTNSPQTGDNTNLWLWIALLFVSGGAVITLTVYDRKRRTVNSK